MGYLQNYQNCLTLVDAPKTAPVVSALKDSANASKVASNQATQRSKKVC
jgi:hypothetical protein